MKLDKKQLPQLIILGVLVVVCIGFVSFQLMGSKQATPPAPLRQPDKTEASTEAPGSAMPGESLTAVATGVFPGLSSAVPRRDPFQPVPLPKTVIEDDKSQAAPKPLKSPNHPFRPSGLFAGKVPSISVSPTNPFSLVNGSKPMAEQEKDPEFTLTGVVRGDRNVAIIRTQESGRHVVRQGQTIDGRYRVLTVTDDSATLIYKNRRIHVKLGGVKNAS